MPQHPVAYDGTQDEAYTRSIDLVPIEPSIREGLFLIPSLYGPDAAEVLDRRAPVNLSPPVVSGDHRIPNTLTCHRGTWDGAPTPRFEYQWLLDGTPLPGETNTTIDSVIEWDGMELSCEVRGYNRVGELTVTSNAIRVERIEPIELLEEHDHVITGLSAVNTQTLLHTGTTLITGLGAMETQTVMGAKQHAISGLGAVNTLTIMGAKQHLISGLAHSDVHQVMGCDVYVISLDPPVVTPPAGDDYQYWRVLCQTSSNVSYFGIAELEMRTTISGADETSTGNAIYGAQRSGFEATKAFDGIISGNNSWGASKSAGADAWVGQDFGAGSEKDIVEIAMTSRADSFYNQAPTSFLIQYSSDGVTWTTKTAISGESAWTAAETRVYAVTA